MSKKGKKNKKTKRKIAMRKLKIKLFIIAIIAIIIFAISRLTNEEVHLTKAMKIVETYMSYINEAKYDEMYEMLSESAKGNITKKDFIARNEEMYGQIEASSVTVSNMSEEEEQNRKSKDYIYEQHGNNCRNFNFCKYSKTCKREAVNIILYGHQM